MMHMVMWTRLPLTISEDKGGNKSVSNNDEDEAPIISKDVDSNESVKDTGVEDDNLPDSHLGKFLSSIDRDTIETHGQFL
jgi:hypothetical protein